MYFYVLLHRILFSLHSYIQTFHWIKIKQTAKAFPLWLLAQHRTDEQCITAVNIIIDITYASFVTEMN